MRIFHLDTPFSTIFRTLMRTHYISKWGYWGRYPYSYKSRMPLTYHQIHVEGNDICLFLCPLSIYYYSAGSQYKHIWTLRETSPKPAEEENARIILIG